MQEWGLSEELKIQTKQMIEIAEKELSIMRQAIDKEDECILCKMEDIHHMLANVQTLAATYYIQAYLSPYTESSQFITTAVQHLSARKHGALIVVERNETLESCIQTGTTLNAHLTACPSRPGELFKSANLLFLTRSLSRSKIGNCQIDSSVSIDASSTCSNNSSLFVIAPVV